MLCKSANRISSQLGQFCNTEKNLVPAKSKLPIIADKLIFRNTLPDTGQSVASIYVHTARSTDPCKHNIWETHQHIQCWRPRQSENVSFTFTTRAPKRERRVYFILDLDQGVENHWSTAATNHPFLSPEYHVIQHQQNKSKYSSTQDHLFKSTS